MSWQTAGIVLCSVFVLIAIVACVCDFEGRKGLPPPSKDTDRKHDAGFWS